MGIEAPGVSGRSGDPATRRQLFISYANADAEHARGIRVALEGSGHSCWMAPDDVVASRSWAEQITEAINNCRAMLVLVSRSSLASRHVPKEAELAFSREKPLIPVRLEDVVPTGSLEYLLSLTQWVDAFPGPIDGYVEELLSRIGHALATSPDPHRGATQQPNAALQPNATPRVGKPPPLVRPRSGARRIRRLVFGLVALATIIISILSFVRADAAVRVQARELWVDPNPAQPGAIAVAHGRDWAPGNPVEIQWGAAFGSVVGAATTNTDGTFAISFTVPGGAAEGAHEVWACVYAPGTGCEAGNEFMAMNSTTLTVETDEPPVANSDAFTTAMGVARTIRESSLIANDFDPDGDAMCPYVSIVDDPAAGVLEYSGGAWVYTPRWGMLGNDGFSYQVCDEVHYAWSNAAWVSIDVVFDGTVGLNPTSGPPGTEVTATGSGFIPGWEIEIRWDGTRVANGVADGSGWFSIRFVAEAAQQGWYEVRACRIDSDACASTSFDLLASPTTSTTAPTTTTAPDESDAPLPTPENLAPSAGADLAILKLGTPLQIDVLANDRDPDGTLRPDTLRIVTPPQLGTARVSGLGLVSYEPGAGFEGSDQLRYEICDEEGACAQGLVTIRATELPPCPPDALVVESFSADPGEGSPGTQARLALRVDADALAGCFLTGVQFFWSGEPWGASAGFTGDAISVERLVPSDAVAGAHRIEARYLDTNATLAVIDYTVVVPAAGDTPQGRTSPPWQWIPIGVAVVGGAAWMAWRRWRAPARALKRLRGVAATAAAEAAELVARAKALNADLADCEAAHGKRVAALPAMLGAREGAGGTNPYLLEWENVHAPTQEDGHRGWYYLRRKEPIRGIVVHTTEGRSLAGKTADHIARYFATCRRPASAHAVVDARGTITLLPDDYTALHMPLANSASLGLVVCLTDDPEQQRRAVEHAARWCRSKAEEHDFPMLRLDADSWRIGGFGILGHSDLESGATDPVAPGGTAFPWETLIDPDSGPSRFPGVVPVWRPGPDPCADIRAEATGADRAAEKASRRAADAAARAASAAGRG